MIDRNATKEEIEEFEKLFDNSKPIAILKDGVWYYREDRLFQFLKNYIINILVKRRRNEKY